MPFARNHALVMVTPDDPAYENKPSDWNAGHALSGAVSGGIPYFSSTTAEGTSALLAAADPVLGGGAGSAPYTDAGFTGTGTGATYVATLNGLTVTAAPTFSALTSGRIPFSGTAGLQGDNANLTFSATGSPGGGPLFTVGSGTTTSVGLQIGYATPSGYSGIWSAGVAPTDVNAAILFGTNQINIGLSGSAATYNIYTSNSAIQKLGWTMTAGRGPDIIAGTAASAVSAETITQTWNFNTSAINAVDWTFTDTSSHAGTLAWRVRGGAAGATALASLTKAGKMEAVAYRVNGTDGANFGPGLPTTITVVNGIVTAAA